MGRPKRRYRSSAYILSDAAKIVDQILVESELYQAEWRLSFFTEIADSLQQQIESIHSRTPATE